jgi:hypothetical protein
MDRLRFNADDRLLLEIVDRLLTAAGWDDLLAG